jgi:hypothetical protein
MKKAAPKSMFDDLVLEEGGIPGDVGRGTDGSGCSRCATG